MTDLPRASQLRQRILKLASELLAVQKDLLRRRQMIAASLVERHLGSTEEKRSSSAFYLSFLEEGRTRLVYVPRDRLDAVRAQVEAWREYRAGVRRWRELSLAIYRLWRELGQAQAQDPGKGKR